VVRGSIVFAASPSNRQTIMFLEITGAIIVAIHFIVIGLLIVWFGLRKPVTFAEFWLRFRRAFFSLGPHTSPRSR
jgi:formate-dependent nitrite reductase membrane component NrfD